MSLEEFKQKSLEEMASCKIDFGRAHMGKDYGEMWNNEKAWCRWFIRTYGTSEKLQHQKLLHYFELQIERLELEMALPDFLDAPEQMIVAPKTKAKAKAKAKAMNHPTPGIETDFIENWDFMDEEPASTTEVEALQDRMATMESMMQEMLNALHSRPNP